MIKSFKSPGASHIDELDRVANAEMAARSKRVAFVYVPLVLLIAYATSLHRVAGYEMSVVTVFFTMMGVLRHMLTSSFQRHYDHNPRRWMLAMSAIVMLPGVVSGLSLPLIYFKVGSGWDMVVAMLIVCGLSAGSTSSLAPRINLFRLYQVTVQMPIIITLLFFASGKYQLLGLIMFVSFVSFMLLGHYYHREFWSGLIANHQLKQRARELESANEAIARNSEARSKFLATMSHEIRTPLNGILGMTDLALETDLNPQQTEYLQDVKGSSEALLNIVNEILDLSKIEAGGIILEKTRISIEEIVNRVAKPLKYTAQTKDNRLELEMDPALDCDLLGEGTGCGRC
jgi:signal transduction histidine kinase